MPLDSLLAALTSSPTSLKASAEALGARAAFYEGNDKVWLADIVPGRFISLR